MKCYTKILHQNFRVSGGSTGPRGHDPSKSFSASLLAPTFLEMYSIFEYISCCKYVGVKRIYKE